MAEGLLNHFGKGLYKAYSAGTVKTAVNPLAIKVLSEIGIDIRNNFSKDLSYFLNKQFDLAITVCDSAAEACPNFSNVKETLHWSLEDPSQAKGTEEEKLRIFRSARDKIAKKINDYFKLG